MTKTISSIITSALNLNNNNPLPDQIEQFFAVEMFFDSGTVRLWSGIGTKTINGNSFLGTGDLLGISETRESGDMTAHELTFSLDGLDSGILTAALTEQYQGRRAKVLWGITTGNDAVEIFAGFMDIMTINDNTDRSQISLTIESKLLILERPQERRYTQSSHLKRIQIDSLPSSNDSFFNWTVSLGNNRIVPWGKNAE
jgi:hypothetical protein